MRPDIRYKRIDNVSGLRLGAVFPIVQEPVADASIGAQRARGTTTDINSGLRTLADQYILYRWYQLKRCGIALAAKPGSSNHESGLAVDIKDNAGWRHAMEEASFMSLGTSDPVHFDYDGRGTIDPGGCRSLLASGFGTATTPTIRSPRMGLWSVHRAATSQVPSRRLFERRGLHDDGGSAGHRRGRRREPFERGLSPPTVRRRRQIGSAFGAPHPAYHRRRREPKRLRDHQRRHVRVGRPGPRARCGAGTGPPVEPQDMPDD